MTFSLEIKLHRLQVEHTFIYFLRWKLFIHTQDHSSYYKYAKKTFNINSKSKQNTTYNVNLEPIFWKSPHFCVEINSGIIGDGDVEHTRLWFPFPPQFVQVSLPLKSHQLKGLHIRIDCSAINPCIEFEKRCVD